MRSEGKSCQEIYKPSYFMIFLRITSLIFAFSVSSLAIYVLLNSRHINFYHLWHPLILSISSFLLLSLIVALPKLMFTEIPVFLGPILCLLCLNLLFFHMGFSKWLVQAIVFNIVLVIYWGFSIYYYFKERYFFKAWLCKTRIFGFETLPQSAFASFLVLSYWMLFSVFYYAVSDVLSDDVIYLKSLKRFSVFVVVLVSEFVNVFYLVHRSCGQGEGISSLGHKIDVSLRFSFLITAVNYVITLINKREDMFFDLLLFQLKDTSLYGRQVRASVEALTPSKCTSMFRMRPDGGTVILCMCYHFPILFLVIGTCFAASQHFLPSDSDEWNLLLILCTYFVVKPLLAVATAQFMVPLIKYQRDPESIKAFYPEFRLISQ